MSQYLKYAVKLKKEVIDGGQIKDRLVTLSKLGLTEENKRLIGNISLFFS